MSTLCTPTKCSSSCTTRHVSKTPLISPYFTPSRKRAAKRTSSPCGHRSKRERGIEPKDFATPTSSADETQKPEYVLKDEDPLFRFYVRSFTRLYVRLALAKPGLIQERVSDDPWKVLVAVTLLNKTAGKLAIPVFWELMSHYPTPRTFSQASPEFVQSLLQPLGLHVTRSKRLIDLSLAFLQDPPRSSQLRRSRSYQSLPFSSIPSSSPSSPLRATDTPSHPEPKRSRYPPTPISHLPGTGPYALDSYRIFCTPCEWKEVMPSDKELIRYLKWKWAFCERKIWTPGVGVVGSVDIEYLETLLRELEPKNEL